LFRENRETLNKSQCFVWRRRVYRERMDTGFELAGERLIDHAMTGESALPPERISHDIDPEMSFSTRLMSGVAFMPVGFVKHLQAQRSEGFSQLP
jgi:hypothetical protein